MTETQVREETREAWLNRAVEALREHVFIPAGEHVPPVRVSVGWPKGGRKVIGQCWKTDAAEDEVSQVFISPVLKDMAEVLETLVHELVHAVDNCESGHRGEFKRIAVEVGLEGKMTATHAGAELLATLMEVAEELGEYPHAALTPALSGVKKQSTRMLKVECPDDGYIVRTTQKWLDIGTPTCPCGTEMVPEPPKEDV